MRAARGGKTRGARMISGVLAHTNSDFNERRWVLCAKRCRFPSA